MPVMASQSARSHIGNLRPVDRIARQEDAAFYTTAGDTLPDIRLSDGLTFVLCKGIFADYVDGIGGLTVDDRGWTGLASISGPYVDMCQLINSSLPLNSARLSKAGAHLGKALKILDDISRFLVLDRKDRYLSYPRPPDCFCADFKAFACQPLHAPPKRRLLAQFLNLFELNKPVFICVTLWNSYVSQLLPPLYLQQLRISICPIQIFPFEGQRYDREYGTRLITAHAGYVGMVPCPVQKGDRICVLLCSSIPLTLRYSPGTTSYEVIRECYLHGFMNGEVLVNLNG